MTDLVCLLSRLSRIICGKKTDKVLSKYILWRRRWCLISSVKGCSQNRRQTFVSRNLLLFFFLSIPGVKLVDSAGWYGKWYEMLSLVNAIKTTMQSIHKYLEVNFLSYTAVPSRNIVGPPWALWGTLILVKLDMDFLRYTHSTWDYNVLSVTDQILASAHLEHVTW